ncbi:MAG TPA: hypothetical protein VLA00_14580 [Xanthobacteraceae bacterium]|nr:hypothetical protein [Xanthobacteraceae bacterium]
MIVDEIIARLKSAPGSPFRLIGAAAGVASIVDNPPAVPAAYVFVKEEGSTENERINGLLQRTELDIVVLIITENVADATGAAAAGDIEQLKGSVRKRLLGWQPASAEEPLSHVGGELVRARGGALWWEMTLAAAVYLTDDA